MIYAECITDGCEYWAEKDELCRYCQGVEDDTAILVERKRKKLPLRPPLRCMLIAVKVKAVKKSKPKRKVARRVSH